MGGGYPPELAWWTGGRPRALVAGEGWGGRRVPQEQGVREGLAWRSGGGARASVAGGLGGRGTGPRDGANFATCGVFVVSNAYKKKKNGFF